ncbi:MAG: hypothetical protein HQM15_05490 [Deltaproteobacteria bacterium]|nr:hypothetical protein [Deltaproteobacteria bacterium]
MKRIFLDTDLFVRYLRYPKDAHRADNNALLDKIKNSEIQGVTSVFNVLETCGVLSYNLSQEDLISLFEGFQGYFNLQILFPSSRQDHLNYLLPDVFEQIKKKQSFGDAQVSMIVEQYHHQLSCFITWNAKHFEGKLSIPVKTPKQYL